MVSMEAKAKDLDCVDDRDLGGVKLESGKGDFGVFFSKITRQNLDGEMWKPFWASQVKIALIMILRIVWARLWMSVCI